MRCYGIEPTFGYKLPEGAQSNRVPEETTQQPRSGSVQLTMLFIHLLPGNFSRRVARSF